MVGTSQQRTPPVIIEPPVESIEEKMARMYIPNNNDDVDEDSIKTDSPTDRSSDSTSWSSSNRSSPTSARPPQPPPHQQLPRRNSPPMTSDSPQGAPMTGTSPSHLPSIPPMHLGSPQIPPSHQNHQQQHRRNVSADSFHHHSANQSSISSLSQVLPSQEYNNMNPNRSPGLPPRQPSPQNGPQSSPRPSFITPSEQTFIPTGGFIPTDPNATEQSVGDSPPTGPQPELHLLNHSHLKPGGNASLLSYSQTISLYRENAKRTNNPDMQFDFAVFMVEAAKPITDDDTARWEFLSEAEKLLKALANRGHSESQYYLANLYASSLLNRKGKNDFEKAFPLFVQASKHNHPDAAYRAAKCYEDGLGCKKDSSKATQFYRKAATLNHPGAMYRLGIAELASELSISKNPRDGVKWLKRSGESATVEYPHALHELGLLHERGVDNVVFVDPEYSVSLYTQAAELGYAPSAFRLGECYEYGKLGCPQDAALSIHYYTLAAQQGHREASFALTAWYLVGSPPVLQQSDNEAYLWARRAAEKELPKAEYAIGYFTEVGIGVPKDLKTAIEWYQKAAMHGENRAIQRLQKQMSNVNDPRGMPSVSRKEDDCKMM